MQRFVGAGLVALVSSCCSAAISGAAVQTPSGDTCVANGNGTAYTLVITLPPDAQEQGGFAFGASGVKITDVKIPGTPGNGGAARAGNLSSENLPANTTAMWNLTTAAVPGSSVTASLTASAAVKGSFVVVPTNAQHTAFYDPIVCQFPKGTATPSSKFTIQGRFVYESATGTWRSSITVPGPGKVNFNQRRVRPSDKTTLLIQSGRVSAGGAGKISLRLRPTTAGRVALRKSGSIKLNLSIEFSPTNGKPANKLLTVTLKT